MRQHRIQLKRMIRSTRLRDRKLCHDFSQSPIFRTTPVPFLNTQISYSLSRSGRNTSNCRQPTSWRQHYRIHRNNSELKITSRAVVWKRIRIHLRQPKTDKGSLFSENGSSSKQPTALLRTWWALHIKSKSCFWRNFATTSWPKVYETPRSFSPQPVVSCTVKSWLDYWWLLWVTSARFLFA